MIMSYTMGKEFIRIVTPVKYNDTVIINIQFFKIVQMLFSCSPLRSKIRVKGSMNDIVFQDIIDNRSKPLGIILLMSVGIGDSKNFSKEVKIGF